MNFSNSPTSSLTCCHRLAYKESELRGQPQVSSLMQQIVWPLFQVLTIMLHRYFCPRTFHYREKQRGLPSTVLDFSYHLLSQIICFGIQKRSNQENEDPCSRAGLRFVEKQRGMPSTVLYCHTSLWSQILSLRLLHQGSERSRIEFKWGTGTSNTCSAFVPCRECANPTDWKREEKKLPRKTSNRKNTSHWSRSEGGGSLSWWRMAVVKTGGFSGRGRGFVC
ncbi:uncharacterized protein LOC135369719 [Ornithodoros turicata]|uniref:uncharacterized protein LOC135369719 n=1 Tax=Ornithodoros turicata TaxID=34597 RepID=UPI0031391062